MKRIGLILDNPKRDLRGLLLVAKELLALGHVPILIPMYGMAYEVPLLGLDAVLVNYLRLNVQNVFKKWKSLGIQIFVLDTEGGLLSDSGSRSPEGWARFVKEKKLGSSIDGYFFWGEKLYQGFVEHSGIPKEKLFVTGSPRYDICSDKWRRILDYPSSGHLLINTNFAGVNPKFSKSVKKEVKNAEQAGLEPDLIRRLLVEQREIMERMIGTVSRLAKDFPHTKFVVRPHPFENNHFYEEHFRGISNIKIDSVGEVFDVLASAKCLLHVNCSTAVEALLFDKLPLNLEFINGTEIKRYGPLPERISYAVSSYEKLLEIIGSSDSGIKLDIKSLVQDEIVPAFGPLDGKASQRIALLLDRLVVQRPKKTKWRLVHESLSIKTGNSYVRSLTKGLIINVLGSELSQRIQVLRHPEKIDKVLSRETTEQLLRRFYEVESDCRKVKIRHNVHPVTHLLLSSLILEIETNET